MKSKGSHLISDAFPPPKRERAKKKGSKKKSH